MTAWVVETPGGHCIGSAPGVGKALDVALLQLWSGCEEPYLRLRPRGSEGASVLVIRLNGTVVVSGEVERP